MRKEISLMIADKSEEAYESSITTFFEKSFKSIIVSSSLKFLMSRFNENEYPRPFSPYIKTCLYVHIVHGLAFLGHKIGTSHC